MSSFRAFSLFALWTAASASAAACALATSGLPPDSSGTGGSGPVLTGVSSSAGPTSGSSSSTGSSGSGGSGPVCATTCETIPQGWTLVRVRDASTMTPDGGSADAGGSDDGGDAGASDAGPTGDAGSDAGLPACAGGGAAAVYHYGPSDAGCTPCSCGGPMGASCTAPQITCSYGTKDCSSNDLQLQDGTDNCSTHISGVPAFGNSAGSCMLTAPATLSAAGTCSFSGGEVTPADMWAGSVVVCPEAESATGCMSGESCLPQGPTADGALCITRPDTTACPAGWTATVTTAFEEGFDARACSACSCTVQCNGGSYDLYTQDACILGSSVTVSTTACTEAPGVFDWSTSSLKSHQATPSVKSCDGAAESGMVSTSAPHQICCR